MIAYTVIDGKVSRMECFTFTETCEFHIDGLLVKDFINHYAGEMSVKDIYFVAYNRDEVHY